jgi:hypothetical protein
MQNSYLHEVNPKTGAYTKDRFKTVWHGFQTMAAGNGRLFVVSQNTLREVDLDNPVPEYRDIDPQTSWEGIQSMTFLGERLYIVQRNQLHQVNPHDGHYDRLAKEFVLRDTQGLAGIEGHLFMVQGNVLHNTNSQLPTQLRTSSTGLETSTGSTLPG